MSVIAWHTPDSIHWYKTLNIRFNIIAILYQYYRTFAKTMCYPCALSNTYQLTFSCHCTIVLILLIHACIHKFMQTDNITGGVHLKVQYKAYTV